MKNIDVKIPIEMLYKELPNASQGIKEIQKEVKNQLEKK